MQAKQKREASRTLTDADIWAAIWDAEQAGDDAAVQLFRLALDGKGGRRFIARWLEYDRRQEEE
jgi:hypothetical protein